MFSTILTSIISLVFAVPSIQLFVNRVEESVFINLSGEDELLEQCVKSGFTLSYDFEAQLCQERFILADNCKERRKIKHFLTYDSITSKYALRSDTLGDLQEPSVSYYSSLKDARNALYQVNNIPLLFLAHRDETFYSSPDTYIQARVTSDCIGDHNQTIGDLSYYLTLGFYRISGFDTGWYEYSIKPFTPNTTEED